MNGAMIFLLVCGIGGFLLSLVLLRESWDASAAAEMQIAADRDAWRRKYEEGLLPASWFAPIPPLTGSESLVDTIRDAIVRLDPQHPNPDAWARRLAADIVADHVVYLRLPTPQETADAAARAGSR